jgi:hypothetical protein
VQPRDRAVGASCAATGLLCVVRVSNCPRPVTFWAWRRASQGPAGLLSDGVHFTLVPSRRDSQIGKQRLCLLTSAQRLQEAGYGLSTSHSDATVLCS